MHGDESYISVWSSVRSTSLVWDLIQHPQIHKWSNVTLTSDGTEFCYKEFRLELAVAFHYLEINLNFVGSF